MFAVDESLRWHGPMDRRPPSRKRKDFYVVRLVWRLQVDGSSDTTI